MQKKYFMIVLPMLFLLSTCGYNNSTQTSGTGTISFGVEWVGGPESAPAAAGIYRAPLDCTAAGITTVEAALYATNPQNTLNLIASGGPWDCSAHTGDITISGPQNGATIGIMGKNAGGGVVYYGEQGNVQATTGPGQVTDIGVIVASYVVPAGVTALAGSGKNLVSWNTVTSAASYNVYWSTAPGVTPANGTKIASATSPYTHTGIANGTTHYYIVTAMRSSIESAGSSEVSALPIAGATIPVTGAATSITETTVTLNGSFDNPEGYSTTASFEYGTASTYGNSTSLTPFVQTGPLNHTANLTGLFQNTTYHYRLATSNLGGTFNGADKTFTTNRAITTIAAASSYPRVLAIDADSVFWTEHNNFGSSGIGSINMVSKLGGTIITLATSTFTNTKPFGIAVDGTNVYWTDTAAGTVHQVSKGGGAVTTLATNLNTPQFIAVDSTHVYWTESDGGTVKKATINSGATTTLASGLGSPMGIAVDDTNVYWTESTGGAVKKLLKSADVNVIPTIIASGLSNPWSITVYLTDVYWTENVFGWSGTTNSAGGAPGGTIKKAGINGGVMTTLATNQKNPQGIAVSADGVYWASYPGCFVAKTGINGGPVTTITPSLSSVCGLYVAVDSTSVYWTLFSGQSIQRADK